MQTQPHWSLKWPFYDLCFQDSVAEAQAVQPKWVITHALSSANLLVLCYLQGLH